MSLKSSSHHRMRPGRATLAALLVALLAIPAGISLATPSTASACPPQGCHVPPDDPPPPPSISLLPRCCRSTASSSTRCGRTRRRTVSRTRPTSG